MGSATAIIGNIGLGKQSAKGTPASSFLYLPALSINVNPQQQVQSLQPEIGGQYFTRGAYKSTVSAGGDIQVYARPDGMGYLLDMLCGSHSTVANNGAGPVAAPGAAPTATSNTGTGSGFAASDVVKVAYTWVTSGGETQVSPVGTFTVAGAGNNVVVNALTPLPTHVTGVNYYVSITNGSTTLEKFNVSAQSGGSFTITGYGTGSAPPGSDTATYADGTYTHTFTPFAPGAGADLPYYTLNKDTAQVWAEQFTDVKLSNLRFNISKGQVITLGASVFGIGNSEISVPVSETDDTGLPVLVACQGAVTLADESAVYSLSGASAVAEQITFDFGNSLSQDENYIGSFMPYDVTLLQRSVGISYELVIRDASLYRAVYRNGGTSSWDPTIFRGALTVSMSSVGNIASSSRPYNCTITIPGMDLMMMPIAMSGGQLIRATLTSQVSMGPSGTDTFSIALTNDKATYA